MKDEKLTTTEFDLIKKYFEPLSPEGAPAFSLSNDGAIYSSDPGQDLVFTNDMLVAGVHFFPDDSPGLIAQKAQRVNLSDLAAMGADPEGYLLSLALPKSGLNVDKWVSEFARGLLKGQKEFSWQIWGGDTVSTMGPITISVTAIGSVKRGCFLSRSGAKPGDQIYVSGEIGDAACGLKVLKMGVGKENYNYLIDRYHLPVPRIKLGRSLVDVATSALDISDGLMADIGHICEESNVGAIINYRQIPTSMALNYFLKSNHLETNEDYSHLVWNGGDDYELLFTISEEKEDALKKISKELSVSITKIGEITADCKAVLVDDDGHEIDTKSQGFSHF